MNKWEMNTDKLIQHEMDSMFYQAEHYETDSNG